MNKIDSEFKRFELSCQLSLYGGKQEDEKKAVYLQRDLEKGCNDL